MFHIHRRRLIIEQVEQTKNCAQFIIYIHGGCSIQESSVNVVCSGILFFIFSCYFSCHSGFFRQSNDKCIIFIYVIICLCVCACELLCVKNENENSNFIVTVYGCVYRQNGLVFVRATFVELCSYSFIYVFRCGVTEVCLCVGWQNGG